MKKLISASLFLVLLTSCASDLSVQQTNKTSSMPTETTVTQAPEVSETPKAEQKVEKIDFNLSFPDPYLNADYYLLLKNEIDSFTSLNKHNINLHINYYEPEKFEQQMRLSFMSGNSYSLIGDMLFTDRLNVTYAARGYFADIYPLIDSNPTSSRENYYTNVLRSPEYNGSLYYFPIHFLSKTVSVNKTLSENDLAAFAAFDTASYSELFDFYNQLEDNPGLNFIKIFFPSKDIRTEISCYVNYENQTCSFESEEFINLLKSFKNAAMLEPEKTISEALYDIVGGIFIDDSAASQQYAFRVLEDSLALQYILPYEDSNFGNLISLTNNKGDVIIKPVLKPQFEVINTANE